MKPLRTVSFAAMEQGICQFPTDPTTPCAQTTREQKESPPLKVQGRPNLTKKTGPFHSSFDIDRESRLETFNREAGEAFFARQPANNPKPTPPPRQVPSSNMERISADHFCRGITAKAKEGAFILEQKNKKAPLGMVAFAAMVVEKTVCPKACQIADYFDGLTITVPSPKACTKAPIVIRLLVRNSCWSTGSQCVVCAFAACLVLMASLRMTEQTSPKTNSCFQSFKLRGLHNGVW